MTMEYSYEVDSQNRAKITYTTQARNGTVSQHNFPHNYMPWTREDAEQWAEATIEAMKDNGDVYVVPVYAEGEREEAYRLAKGQSA